MKLLILTQVVDTEDPVLGFFHRWIEEFAKHYEHIHVICLREGAHTLPHNVTVHSLGKEEGASRFTYVLRFYRYIWQLRKEYDAVFVHMNQIYVILGAPLWRLLRKPVGLWYVHKKVSMSLRCAVVLTNYIFTTSPESFGITTKKRHILGHGIDMAQFSLSKKEKHDVLHVITAGRVSKTKRVKEMIAGIEALRQSGVQARLTIVGGPVTKEDEQYKEEIERNLPQSVTLRGNVAHRELADVLHTADVFLNLSDTGSMDKAVLEALASGVPVVTSNPAFKTLLGPSGLFIESNDATVLADHIVRAQKVEIDAVYARVRTEHSLDRLICCITRELSKEEK